MTGAEAAGPAVREALSAYGLRSAALTLIPAGMINTCYRVDAEGRSYVLKHYRSGLAELGPEKLEFVYATQERLRAIGVPVPAVVPAPGGSHLLMLDDGCVSLSEYAHGRHYARGAMPAKAAAAMGQTLAEIHAALRHLPAGTPAAPPTVEEAHARISGLLRLAESVRAPSAVDAAAISLLRHKLATLEGWTHKLPEVAPQWIHGDFQDTNVIFTEASRVAAVVDWDVLRVVNREHEVMRAFEFSFPPGAPGGLDFLEGYARAAHLTEEEAAAFVPRWDFTRTVRTWPVEVRYERPDVYQERWDVFISEPSGWWEANRERIRQELIGFAKAALA